MLESSRAGRPTFASRDSTAGDTVAGAHRPPAVSSLFLNVPKSGMWACNASCRSIESLWLGASHVPILWPFASAGSLKFEVSRLVWVTGRGSESIQNHDVLYVAPYDCDLRCIPGILQRRTKRCLNKYVKYVGSEHPSKQVRRSILFCDPLTGSSCGSGSKL